MSDRKTPARSLLSAVTASFRDDQWAVAFRAVARLFHEWNTHLLAVILLVAASDIALMVLYALGWRARSIFGEDRALEMTTAFLFLAAWVVGLLHLLRQGARHYPVLLPAAASLGLLGFLDEVSFGARYFGWSMPEMPGGGEFDGAHDLVILTYRLAAGADSTIVGIVAGSLIAVALVCVLRWRERLHGLAHRILADRAYSAMARCSWPE